MHLGWNGLPFLKVQRAAFNPVRPAPFLSPKYFGITCLKIRAQPKVSLTFSSLLNQIRAFGDLIKFSKL
jgi:hypothetical protein